MARTARARYNPNTVYGWCETCKAGRQYTEGKCDYCAAPLPAPVAIRGVNSGEVVLTMNRAQAQACYDALMTEPMRDYGPQECAECFLIVQLADALGYPVIKPIRDRASVCE